MNDTPQRQRTARDERLVDPPAMRLTERDIDLMQAVYAFRTLTTDQIQSLFFPSKHQAYARLHLLYHNGYLDRILRGAHADRMSTPMLYVLDKRGADLLRRQRGLEDAKKPLLKDTTFTFLEHTLAMNEVRIAITKAAKPPTFQLTKWINENDLKADYDYVTIRTDSGRSQRVAVIPDSFFILETPFGAAACALELDRGTETLARWKQKIKGYLVYYTSGAYQRRFGMKSLRVLTVTSSRARLQNLHQATEAVGGKQRFWFTTLDQVNEQTVLSAPIWQVADAPGLRPLIDPIA